MVRVLKTQTVQSIGYILEKSNRRKFILNNKKRETLENQRFLLHFINAEEET